MIKILIQGYRPIIACRATSKRNDLREYVPCTCMLVQEHKWIGMVDKKL